MPRRFSTGIVRAIVFNSIASDTNDYARGAINLATRYRKYRTLTGLARRSKDILSRVNIYGIITVILSRECIFSRTIFAPYRYRFPCDLSKASAFAHDENLTARVGRLILYVSGVHDITR